MAKGDGGRHAAAGQGAEEDDAVQDLARCVRACVRACVMMMIWKMILAKCVRACVIMTIWKMMLYKILPGVCVHACACVCVRSCDMIRREMMLCKT